MTYTKTKYQILHHFDFTIFFLGRIIKKLSKEGPTQFFFLGSEYSSSLHTCKWQYVMFFYQYKYVTLILFGTSQNFRKIM